MKSIQRFFIVFSFSVFFIGLIGSLTTIMAQIGNTKLGKQTGTHITGDYNTFLGSSAGTFTTTGTRNLFVGSNSGKNNNTGSKNTYLGSGSGLNSTGSNNVFIGYSAGFDHKGSNKLIISNSSTHNPLIFGDFSKKELVFNGDIGIGAKKPSAKLHVKGNAPNDAVLLIEAGEWKRIGDYAEIRFQDSKHYIREEFGKGMQFHDEHKFIFEGGNVGIGTSKTESYKLAVNGNIKAHDIHIFSSSWADEVFKVDYKLRSLKEVEDYIKENSHLPDVPTERNVKEEGINLGEMDAILLRKIEELTLYVIDLKKENIATKEANTNLKKINKDMMERLNALEDKVK